MKEQRIAYFLGANSADGFYSLYDALIDEENANAFYILKGGPGCGKSTLMRQVAARMEAEGVAVEYILCSGDPDSLDGILIPEKRVAVVDGTAPHILEPTFPGIVGQYVNMGECYDYAGLKEVRADIIEAQKAYRQSYVRAYQCIRAAWEVRQSGEEPFFTRVADHKIQKRVKGIVQREIPRKGGSGTRIERFLSGISCQGRVCLQATVAAQCKRIYDLRDGVGLAWKLLAYLEEGIRELGVDVVVCLSPENPKRIEHLLIPELSLAFVTNASGLRTDRRIQMETMVEKTVLKENFVFM
ncbi:MAG: hypothetical protein RR053_05730, partial [Evtepia sp.]